MFFDDWYGLLRVALVGASAYFALVLILRVSGKRTLSNRVQEGDVLTLIGGEPAVYSAREKLDGTS